MPILATTGVMSDVPMGKLSFQLCGRMVDFCFPPSSTPSALTVPPIHATSMIPIAPTYLSKVMSLDGDKMLQSGFVDAFESPPPSLAILEVLLFVLGW